MNSYDATETPTHETYARGLMDRRQQYHDYLSLLQTQRDNHYRPLYAVEVSEVAARAHQMTLDLRDQLRPRHDEIEELWSERDLAKIQVPSVDSDDRSSARRTPIQSLNSPRGVQWKTTRVRGLASLSKWRSVRLPRENEQRGRAARSTVEENQRAFMPVALMTGARDAIEEALTELGWLPDGRVTDFTDGGGV